MTLPRAHVAPTHFAHPHPHVPQPHHKKKKRGVPHATGAQGHAGDAPSRLLRHLLAQEDELAATMGGGSSRDASEEDNDAPSEQSDSASSAHRSHAPSLASPTSLRSVSMADSVPNNARDRAVAGARGLPPSGTSARDWVSGHRAVPPDVPLSAQHEDALRQLATVPLAPGSTAAPSDSLAAAANSITSAQLRPHRPYDSRHGDVDADDADDALLTAEAATSPNLPTLSTSAHAPHIDSSGHIPRLSCPSHDSDCRPPTAAVAAQNRPGHAPGATFDAPATAPAHAQSSRKSRSPVPSSSPSLTDHDDISDDGTASPYDGDVEFAARTPVSHQPPNLNNEQRGYAEERSTNRGDQPWIRQTSAHASSAQHSLPSARQAPRIGDTFQASVATDPPTRAYASLAVTEGSATTAPNSTRQLSPIASSSSLTSEQPAVLIQEWTDRLNRRTGRGEDESELGRGNAEIVLYVQVLFDLTSLSQSSAYLRTAKLSLGARGLSAAEATKADEQCPHGLGQRAVKVVAGVVADASKDSHSAPTTTLPLQQRAQLARSSRWVDEVIEGVPYHPSLDAFTGREPEPNESQNIACLLEEVGAHFAAVGVHVDGPDIETALSRVGSQPGFTVPTIRLPVFGSVSSAFDTAA